MSKSTILDIVFFTSDEVTAVKNVIGKVSLENVKQAQSLIDVTTFADLMRDSRMISKRAPGMKTRFPPAAASALERKRTRQYEKLSEFDGALSEALA